MNIEEFDEIQPLLHKAQSILLCAMGVQDATIEELDGALWAASDFVVKAQKLLECAVVAGGEVSSQLVQANAREHRAFYAGMKASASMAPFNIDNVDVEQKWQQYRCQDDSDWAVSEG